MRKTFIVFDNMTHNGRTGQMQVAIVPLMSSKELLTPVYLDNYLTNPSKNIIEDMINLVRLVGDRYYSLTFQNPLVPLALQMRGL